MDQKTLEKMRGFDRVRADISHSSRRSASSARRLAGDCRDAPSSCAQLHPLFAGEIERRRQSARPLDRGDPARAYRRRSTAMRCWCSAVRTSTTSGRWPLPANSARLELPRSGRADVERRLRAGDRRHLEPRREPAGCAARDDPRRFDQLGNRLWHTDGSFRRVPAALSMLYAHRVPAPARRRRDRIRRSARRL